MKKILFLFISIFTCFGCNASNLNNPSSKSISFMDNSGYLVQKIDLNVDEQLKKNGYEISDQIYYFPISVNKYKVYFEIIDQNDNTLALFTLDYKTNEIEIIEEYNHPLRVCGINFYKDQMVMSIYDYSTNVNSITIDGKCVLELTCSYLYRPRLYKLKGQLVGIYGQTKYNQYEIGYFMIDENGFSNQTIDSYEIIDQEYKWYLYPEMASNNNDIVSFYTYGTQMKGYYIIDGNLKIYDLPECDKGVYYSYAVLNHNIFTGVDQFYSIDESCWKTIDGFSEQTNKDILRSVTINDNKMFYIDSLFNTYVGTYNEYGYNQLLIRELSQTNISAYYCDYDRIFIYSKADNKISLYLLEV